MRCHVAGFNECLETAVRFDAEYCMSWHLVFFTPLERKKRWFLYNTHSATTNWTLSLLDVTSFWPIWQISERHVTWRRATVFFKSKFVAKSVLYNTNRQGSSIMRRIRMWRCEDDILWAHMKHFLTSIYIPSSDKWIISSNSDSTLGQYPLYVCDGKRCLQNFPTRK